MKLSLFLLLTLFIISCTESEKPAKESVPNQENLLIENNGLNKNDIYNSPCYKMDSILTIIDSLKYSDYSVENDELIWEYSKKVKTLASDCAEYMAEKSTYLPNNFDVCWSADSLLGILSWNTRMGGTFVNVEHVKFSKGTSGAILYKSTDEVKKSDGDINATSYSQIAKLPIQGKDIYICKGAGKTSNPTFYYSLDVVEITKNEIIPANIFPDSQSEVSVSYDMMEMIGDKEALEILVLPIGDIQIPEIEGYSNPTGNYITWKLKNGLYQEKLPYEAFVPEGYDILDVQEGHLYQDGNDKMDVVLVLRDTAELNEDTWDSDLARPLIILRAVDDGYEQVLRVDDIVMCQGCGGVFGDPFDYLEISTEEIEIGHYGGSSQRWFERYKFMLDEGGNNWELVETVYGGHSVFDEDGDGEIDEYEEIIETKADFGTILIEDFGKN